MIVTEICVSCKDETNCNNINYETMKCNGCSVPKEKRYVRDIRFCQHCHYFKYSSFWFDVLSKNMCYECASSDITEIQEKQEEQYRFQNIYRHIVSKLPIIQELPEECPRRKRKYEKKYTEEQRTEKTNKRVRIKTPKEIVTHVCNVCFEEKSSKHWFNFSTSITCSQCYYKSQKINKIHYTKKQRTCISCKCCKETKMSFNWYNNDMCDDCYKPKKSR